MRSELRAGSTPHSVLHTRRSAGGVPVLRFAALAGEPGLVHGISTREGGVSHGPYATLNVSLVVGDERERVAENRTRLARAVAGEALPVYSCRQVHGAAGRVIDAALAPGALDREPVDILLTGEPGHLLLLKFADCTPLLVYDPRRRWVAVAHAGWRGT